MGNHQKQQAARMEKTRLHYGKDCFKRFGSKGGSPILELYREGKLVRRK